MALERRELIFTFASATSYTETSCTILARPAFSRGGSGLLLAVRVFLGRKAIL